MVFQRLHLFLADLSPFKIHILRRLEHQCLIMLDHFTSAALEQRDYLLYVFIILLAGNGTDTAALALAYMEIEARPELLVKDSI